MKLLPIKTNTVSPKENLVDVVLDALRLNGLQLEDNDVVALASKIVSYSENRLVNLEEIHPSEKAFKLAQRHNMRPEFAELILREADTIYGGVEKAILTLKNGMLTANAGIDNKNAPKGYAVLWPRNAAKSAQIIREELMLRSGKRIGVLIVDSSLAPLRIGTSGQALAVAGFRPIIDRRKEDDLFGKPIIITRHAIADDLSSAAQVLMGEAAERVPFVLIKKAPIEFDDGVYDSADMMMPFEQCIYMGTFLQKPSESTKE